MKSTSPSLVVHWTGRVAAVALAGFFLMFLFGESEGTIDLPNQPRTVQLIFLGWAGIFFGYAVGWIYPVIGGAVVLSSLAGMNVANGRLLGPWFFLWGLPGLLYLFAGWLRCRPPSEAVHPTSV
jgi:hypothetical protein